ncbi:MULTISPECIES: Uma2 family endonuclease [Calothrix]|uniref:Uma2 family endonuclease n=2 Tax=Calothrix TaxID=1186 RepID=A0ABR8AC44_9CYAN|nr:MULTISPECIES: Uma2 family endonuclease [Calothrix]MBD2197463.1 Uma2 family endonuclease [Calothrix parietina FACHB-288]MBD2226030.1 Uma2 family endonuclease [Calothrix anomala FACHB-343]
MTNIELTQGKIIVKESTTLEEFLKLPYIEESPAWEYINGEAIQKPMGGAKHSLLQKRLVSVIDSLDSNYEAFPELRCTFGNRSVVPDVVVISSNHLPLDENGEIISSGIDFAPAWVIEILSPAQSQTKVTGNILHCLRNGSQLGWLIDPSERCILVYQPNSLPDLLTGKDILPVLTDLNLTLSVDDVFAWLQRKI